MPLGQGRRILTGTSRYFPDMVNAYSTVRTLERLQSYSGIRYQIVQSKASPSLSAQWLLNLKIPVLVQSLKSSSVSTRYCQIFSRNCLIRPGNKFFSSSFFVKGDLFQDKGGPPVLDKPARHLPRQGRGFVRPPVCPTPPALSSFYGGASGGQRFFFLLLVQSVR